MYKKEMISAFYHEFRMINNEKYYYTILVDIEEQTLRKRLKNIFTFSNLPKNESEKLINNFISTKSLNEIINHKKK